MSKHPVVSAVGLEMPEEFPTGLYNSVHSKLEPLARTGSLWRDFGPAWNAVAYRYRACSDCSDELATSIRHHGAAPAQPKRYLQERAMFGFFVNALSTLEALAFALYAIGSAVQPRAFPLSSERDRRNVTPAFTRTKYVSSFPTAALSRALGATLDAPDYRNLKSMRDVLAHRGQPGRDFSLSLGVAPARSARWAQGLVVEPTMLHPKRLWLSRRTRAILLGAEGFVEDNLSG